MVEDVDGYGECVAIQGDHALVGAPAYDSGQTNNIGAVFYYHYEGDPGDKEWVLKQTITVSSEVTGLGLGRSIDVNSDGDVIVVGALGGGVFTQGRAYIFTRSGTTWSGGGSYLRGSDTTNADLFGSSVAIVGDDLIAVGAPSWPTGSAKGSVYVFRKDGTWSEEQQITDASGSNGDQLGMGLALSNVHLLIGAPGYNSAAGRVFPFLYDDVNEEWDALTAIGVAGSGHLGESIGLDGAYQPVEIVA